MSEHWIVARTKSKAEFIARMNIEAQGYNAYLPLVSVDGVLGPMLPGYLFVDVEPRAGLWRPVENTRGCSTILMTGERPSHVPTRDIEDLRSREEAGAIRIRTKLQPKVNFTKGQPVKIIDGPFQGFEAIFERESGKDRVALWLTYMGRVVPVHPERHQVACG